MRTVVPMTEADLLEAVRSAALLSGWGLYHTRDSRGSYAGFPDLVMWHPRRRLVLFRELKGEGGRVSIDQADTIDALVEAGANVRVWWPGDLDDALDVITGRRR